MTSKLIVNNIEADTGVSTITFGSEISASKITTSSTSAFSSGLNVTGGSVGIGTDNPTEQLHVSTSNTNFGLFQSSSTSNGNLILDKTGASGNPNIRFDVQSQPKIYLNVNRSQSDSFNIYTTVGGENSRLTVLQGGNIGAGGITTPTFTTGGGIHLGDAYGIGFGNGANGRPDFQIVYDTGQNNGLQIRCGNGADTADVYFTTAGNLAFDSGKGIDFSATSDGSGTTTSELLDDYEEGTWTPVLEGSTTNPTYSGTQSGHYTKVGNMVTCWGYIDTNPVTGAGSGNISISGLPFASGLPSASTYNGSVAVYGPTFSGTLSSRINNTSTSIIFYQIASNTAISQWTFATASWSSGDAIYFQVSYTV